MIVICPKAVVCRRTWCVHYAPHVAIRGGPGTCLSVMERCDTTGLDLVCIPENGNEGDD